MKQSGFIPILSIKDIAVNKVYAIGRRANYRDYFDLYVLLKNKYLTLSGLIRLCKRKFGELFSERNMLEQITYLKDVNPEEKLRFVKESFVTKEELEGFF